MNKEEYSRAVLKTEAGDLPEISKRLTTHSTMRLLHASMGLASEIAELLEALSTEDLANIIEELGDGLWYSSIGLDVLGSRFDFSEIEKGALSGNPWHKFETLTIESGEILSAVKAHIFYGRELDPVDLICRFQEVGRLIDCIAHIHEKAIGEVMDINIEKLHRKRYKGAEFSEHAANNRDLNGERKLLEGLS